MQCRYFISIRAGHVPHLIQFLPSHRNNPHLIECTCMHWESETTARRMTHLPLSAGRRFSVDGPPPQAGNSGLLRPYVVDDHRPLRSSRSGWPLPLPSPSCARNLLSVRLTSGHPVCLWGPPTDPHPHTCPHPPSTPRGSPQRTIERLPDRVRAPDPSHSDCDTIGRGAIWRGEAPHRDLGNRTPREGGKRRHKSGLARSLDHVLPY